MTSLQINSVTEFSTFQSNLHLRRGPSFSNLHVTISGKYIAVTKLHMGCSCGRSKLVCEIGQHNN